MIGIDTNILIYICDKSNPDKCSEDLPGGVVEDLEIVNPFV